MKIVVVAALLLVAGVACNNNKTSNESAAGEPSASAAQAPSASASAIRADPSAPTKWSGAYTASSGNLYYPRDAPNAKDWKELTWNGADASTGLGDGTMDLAIDPKKKLVSGSAGGPIGDVAINGSILDDKISAKVERKDPSDHGLTGTATGTVKGDTIEGEMKLSSSDATVLRTATFKLTKQK